jgi:hypothetical protein
LAVQFGELLALGGGGCAALRRASAAGSGCVAQDCMGYEAGA